MKVSTMASADTHALVQRHCEAEAAAHAKALQEVQSAAATAAESAAATTARTESERDAARATLACTEDRLRAALLVHALQQTPERRCLCECGTACSSLQLKNKGGVVQSRHAAEWRSKGLCLKKNTLQALSWSMVLGQEQGCAYGAGGQGPGRCAPRRSAGCSGRGSGAPAHAEIRRMSATGEDH